MKKGVVERGRLWLVWTVATFLGVAVARHVSFRLDPISRIILTGAVIGLFQAAVLCLRLADGRGYVFGSIAGASAGVWLSMPAYWAVYGAVAGLLQAYVLRWRINLRFIWITASTVGWWLGGWLGSLAASRASGILLLPILQGGIHWHLQLTLLLAWGVPGAVDGAVTGGVLASMSSRPPSNDDHDPTVAEVAVGRGIEVLAWTGWLVATGLAFGAALLFLGVILVGPTLR